jgi:hypothetical protein
MKLIDDWLNGKRNFITGKSLYNVLGKNEKLKQLFALSETAFSKQKLIDALTALNVAPVKVQTPEEISFDVMPVVINDDVLTSLANAWKEKYARMNMLRYQLDQYGEDNSTETVAVCEPICKEILQLEKEVNALWKQRDYYLEHKQLPEVKTKRKVLSEKVADSATEIENIKKNIRRNKSRMVRFAAKPLYAQKYNDYLQQYKELTGEDYKERVK